MRQGSAALRRRLSVMVMVLMNVSTEQGIGAHTLAPSAACLHPVRPSQEREEGLQAGAVEATVRGLKGRGPEGQDREATLQ